MILALTSVMAHSSQSVAMHAPSKSGLASIMNTVEAQQDATEAAELLAAEQKKAARLAAKIQHDAAVAAEEAAEKAAQAACQATDQPEDATERANDQAEDAAETPGANDQAEDAAEKAADATEDATEVPCGEGGEHHVGGGNKHGHDAGSDNDRSGFGGEHRNR